LVWRLKSLGGNQIALHVACLGLVHGRIELDQNLSFPHDLTIMDVDRAYDAGLERLDDLGVAGVQRVIPAWGASTSSQSSLRQ
jgi:hypothetical protein